MVLLAILAVMWAAFILPVALVGRRGRRGSARHHGSGGSNAGWRPSPGADRHGPGRQRDTPRRLASRDAVLRRRRILVALTVAVVVAVRVWYLLGGRWWTATVLTGALLLAYLAALVVQGWRRQRPIPLAVASARPPLRGRRRRQADLPRWSAPLLEGQASSRTE